MTRNLQPIIAITMGDPAGVGPEVTVKALAHQEVWACCRPLVIGDASVLQKAVAVVGSSLSFRAISRANQALYNPSSPDTLDQRTSDWIPYGFTNNSYAQVALP